MIEIPGGTLQIGSTEYYPEEGPIQHRQVAAFELDEYPVTNAQFYNFVQDTGYVTVAERTLDPALYPQLSPAELAPGAMVFTPTRGPVDLDDWRQWWRWVPGAHWKRPFGPSSSLRDRMDHPVVQISYEDARSYAKWAAKRLPTEAEWEWAARAGKVGERFSWGDEPHPSQELLANTWQGSFPYRNTGAKGWVGTAPVGLFAPNAYGLYDMIGNVWEWTADYWTPRHLPESFNGVEIEHRASLFSEEEQAQIPRRVLKGGSHLCSPSYCLRYRPAARSAQAEDTAMTHIGFRCAR